MQCYARYPDESWSSSFLRSRPPLDTTLSPCFRVPSQPAPTSHSDRRPPGQYWTRLVPPLAGHHGSPRSYSPDQPWGPTSPGSGAVPGKPSSGAVPIGAPGLLHTSRGPPPLSHVWSTRSTPAQHKNGALHQTHLAAAASHCRSSLQASASPTAIEAAGALIPTLRPQLFREEPPRNETPPSEETTDLLVLDMGM